MCGVEILCLIFFITQHLGKFFCVQPWDKFGTLERYLHHNSQLKLKYFWWWDGSMHFFKKTIAQA
jgi:hypothetical protein